MNTEKMKSDLKTSMKDGVISFSQYAQGRQILAHVENGNEYVLDSEAKQNHQQDSKTNQYYYNSNNEADTLDKTVNKASEASVPSEPLGDNGLETEATLKEPEGTERSFRKASGQKQAQHHLNSETEATEATEAKNSNLSNDFNRKFESYEEAPF